MRGCVIAPAPEASVSERLRKPTCFPVSWIAVRRQASRWPSATRVPPTTALELVTLYLGPRQATPHGCPWEPKNRTRTLADSGRPGVPAGPHQATGSHLRGPAARLSDWLQRPGTRRTRRSGGMPSLLDRQNRKDPQIHRDLGNFSRASLQDHPQSSPEGRCLTAPPRPRDQRGFCRSDDLLDPQSFHTLGRGGGLCSSEEKDFTGITTHGIWDISELSLMYGV